MHRASDRGLCLTPLLDVKTFSGDLSNLFLIHLLSYLSTGNHFNACTNAGSFTGHDPTGPPFPGIWLANSLLYNPSLLTITYTLGLSFINNIMAILSLLLVAYRLKKQEAKLVI